MWRNPQIILQMAPAAIMSRPGKDSAGLAAAVEDPESVKRPNIIVIMDEAFSDLAVRGEFTTNEDYMPFIHSLQQGAENTRTGYLNVSVLGGNTANTEFEFLTGSTIGFYRRAAWLTSSMCRRRCLLWLPT